MRSSSPPIGAIGFGKSGVGYPLVRAEGDRLVLRSPQGLIRIPAHSIVRWEVPTLAVGALVRVTYPEHWSDGLTGIVAAEHRGFLFCKLNHRGYTGEFLFSPSHLTKLETTP